MRLNPWLAPLTLPRAGLAGKVLRRKVARRKTANLLSQMTERLETRTLLTAFTVDSYLDTVDANPGDGFALDTNGKTSLRAAVMEANALAGLDQIFLQGGTYRLSLQGNTEDAAMTGDLDITDPDGLQIFGTSSFSTLTTIIDAQNIDRVFEVFPGVSLELVELGITGGDLRGQGDGGAIRVDSGTLTTDFISIAESRANNGGAISNTGGIVTVSNSVLRNNRAEGDAEFSQGGAIESTGGTVTVQESTIHDNHAMSVGGGIAISTGTLNVTNSTIAQNNTGEAQMSSGDGGGIYIESGATAALLASTVAFNNAGNEGGGIWTNGSLTLERTLISNNVTNSGNGPEGFFSGGVITSNGHNLVREDTNFNFTSANGDLVGSMPSLIDPNIIGLGDNGGLTPTIALGAGSPAIDAGPTNEFPLAEDQRGFARLRDGNRDDMVFTDIGAFEVQSPADFFVDDAGDYLITNDQGAQGFDFGDTVTFDPNGSEIAGLIVGERAFTTINDARTAAFFSRDAAGGESEIGPVGDLLNEIVLGPGTYFESVLLNVPDLLVRGHSGVATDTIIDAGGESFGLRVTADGVQLNSLRVTNAVTGIDISGTSLTNFQASNIQVDGNSEDGIRFVETPGTSLELQIRDSILSSNDEVGLKVTGADTVELQNVTASSNNVDGIAIRSVFETVLDTVTVNGNGDLGFNLQNVGPLWVRNPGTSLNTNGNEFTNVSVLTLEPVSGNIGNSVTVTDTAIQFNTGTGTQQETLTLSDVATVQITGTGGSDTFVIDYSAASPPLTRQLFLNGGQGNDTILSVNDANQRLTNDRLTIGGIDDIVIVNFEQASLTGGAGNNDLNATAFDGQVTLNGLAGNDTLRGSSGNDVLDGGADDDILDGGPLRKQYVLGDMDFETLNLNDTDTGVVTILDEVQTAKIPLDTAFFRFNDVTYTGDNLFVAPSGVASLGGPILPQNNFDLTDAPNFVGGIPILAPLFDNWVTGGNAPPGLAIPDAKVLYKFEDTNFDLIDDRLIIEWNEVYHLDQIDTFSTPFLKSGASPVTFQLILELNTSDRDGDITFNYVDLDTGTPFSSIANGISATVGARDGGEHPGGVQQVSFNSPNSLVASNRAIAARSADSDGNDILTGDSGNDVLFSSSGNDSIDGGDGANDRFIFGSFNNDLASDHMIDSSAIESTVFQTPNRSVNFKAAYTNIEALDVGLGPADQNVVIDVDGLPDSVSLDTQGPSASDTVTIVGTAPFTPSGVVLFDGNYSGTYTGTFSVGEGQNESIPGPTFSENSVAAAISNGSISVSQPDPGSGTVDPGGNITFTSPGLVMGTGYTVEFTGTLLESGGAASGSGTWTVLSNPNGISGSGSWSIMRDSGAPIASSGADNFALSGSTISVGATTLNLAGVESLVLDIANGGTDTVSVHQDFSGSAHEVVVSGDLPDDSISIQSTTKQQQVETFNNEEESLTVIRELLGSEIVLEEVLNDNGNDGSANTIQNQQAPDQVVVSPDGTRVYVAASDSDALVVYSRDRVTGDLTFIESLANMGMDTFGNTITGLDGASKVIVSADGRNVYVASELDQTIAFFVRQDGGNQLSFISSTILDVDGNPVNIASPSDMALIPNGSVLVVSSETGNRINFFDVGSTGDLVFQGSLQDGGQDSGMTTIDGLAGASSIAMSPDGRHIYVTGSNDNAIAIFSAPSEQSDMSGFALPLFFKKLANGDLDTSLNVVSGLAGASSVEVSPDGLHVYVTGETDNSLTVFSRAQDTGDLTFVESLTHNGLDSFGNTVENLLAPAAVSVSPKGTTVYVAASGSNAVTLFNRDTSLGTTSSGSLTFLETLSSGDTDGAGTTVVGLNGVSSIFASVDGQHVYAAGTGDDAVVRFNTPRLLEVSPDGNAALSITTSDANDVFFIRPFARSGNLTINAGGSSDNDGVTILGTDLADTFGVNGGTLISGGSAYSLTNVEGLNLLLNDGDDTVNITASSSGPTFFIVDGGPQTGSDVLNIDAQAAQVINDGSNISFTGGLNSVGNSNFETVAITNATPTIDDDSFVIAEDAPISTTVGTPVASDPETGESLDWSILSGNTGGAFAINALTGEITVTAALDFEVLASYVLIVEVEDNQNRKDMATVNIGVTDSEPMISNQSFTVDENAKKGAAVGTVALDPGDQNSINYSISAGNTGGAFAINASSGQITVEDTTVIDFEIATSFGLTVVVTDDSGTTTDSATVTIAIADIKPMVGDQSFNVLENQPNATNVGTVILDEGDNNNVTFSITSGNTGTAFAIDSENGQITIANTEAIDFETSSSFSLTVQVTDDGGTTTDTGIVTLNIQDVNDPPIIEMQSFNVDENSIVTTPVGTVIANDFETPSTLMYAITGGDPFGQFAINPSTGAITVANIGLDHESVGSFNLTVQITDPSLLSASATVIINVDDVNEAPILAPIGNQTATVDEELAFTAFAVDPDSPPAPLTFSLGNGAPAGASITANGDFTFTPTSAFDGTSVAITIIVNEDNSGGLTASETIVISVSSAGLDFGDAPVTFSTLLADDGPRHVIGSLFLGKTVDAELDGQPGPAAQGDDNNNTGQGVIIDDEDGITFLSSLGVGTTRQFRVSTSEAGFLDVWIDFDQNGSFTVDENLSLSSSIVVNGGGSAGSGGPSLGPGGGNSTGTFNVGTGIAVPAGFSTVSFGIPVTAIPGPTIARFRLSSTGGLTPNGLASDGEVEDYRIGIAPPPIGNSNSIESALDTAVGQFFNAFPDELNDPDPNIDGTELPLAVQATNGARAERRNGAPPLDETDPALRTVIQAINDSVEQLEQDRGVDEHILVVATHPVDFLLTDTQGRTVGFTQDGGTVNEIGADATFTGDGVVELLTIRNADPGDYGLQLVGVGGVFRGGSSLITPAGTQEITFQGSLVESDEVQLALTYQEGLASFPTRTDLKTVDFSEIADFVAQNPTSDSDAKKLAAGVTEALASIDLDRLDASLFSKKEYDEEFLQRLRERIRKATSNLLDAIEPLLDEDELKSLKLSFDEDAEGEDNVEVLAKALLETLSGPLEKAPQQVKELSGMLQQLLDQLQKQRKKNQERQETPQPANDPKGAVRPQAEDKRTSQYSPARTPATVINSAFIVSTNDAAKRRRVALASGIKRTAETASFDPQSYVRSNDATTSQPASSQSNTDSTENSDPVED